jgi:hypothetical protein
MLLDDAGNSAKDKHAAGAAQDEAAAVVRWFADSLRGYPEGAMVSAPDGARPPIRFAYDWPRITSPVGPPRRVSI